MMLYRCSLLKTGCGLRVRYVTARNEKGARKMVESDNEGWTISYVEEVDDHGLHASRKTKLAERILEAMT